MQTTQERRAALIEHIQLIKQLPQNGTRVSLESSTDQSKKPAPPTTLTKTEHIYRR